MARVDEPLPGSKRQRVRAVDTQKLETNGRPANVDDRIDRANLMKMHPIDWGAMDVGLRLRHELEDRKRTDLHCIWQRRRLNHRPNFRPIALWLVRFKRDRNAGAVDAVLLWANQGVIAAMNEVNRPVAQPLPVEEPQTP